MLLQKGVMMSKCEKYFFIDGRTIISSIDVGCYLDCKRKQIGNYFKTLKEAEKHKGKKIILNSKKQKLFGKKITFVENELKKILSKKVKLKPVSGYYDTLDRRGEIICQITKGISLQDYQEKDFKNYDIFIVDKVYHVRFSIGLSDVEG